MTDTPASGTTGFETRAIHAGGAADPATGARNVPIYQTNAYVFRDAAHAASLFNLEAFGNIYTRLTNPTVSALEEKVAALEGGSGAVATASGHAAQMLTLFNLMQPGDRFIAARSLYGGSINQFSHSFRNFGWHVDFVDARQPDRVRAALRPETRAVFIENLANPGGIVIDMEAVAGIAREAGIPLIVDNTMATPWLCRPLERGADLVVHSLTKFLGGHGAAMGGIVVDSGRFDWGRSGRFPAMTEPDPSYHGLKFHDTFGPLAFTVRTKAIGLRDLGPALAPQNAFLIAMGIETLGLRMQRHVENARTVAAFLEDHPAVGWVSYAGLESSPFRALAKKYMPRGAGSVFTFGVRGGYEAGIRVVENVRLFSHLANIGDTRSLIIHPASTTHRQLTEEQQQAAGAGADVVRVSIGLETVDDIVADLDQALKKAAG